MKYLFRVTFLILIPFSLFSQSLIGGYNSTASGHSISLDYNFKKNKSELGIGFGFNLPVRYLDEDINLYFNKKLYPVETHEFFAVKTYFHRLIYKMDNFRSFAFYDLQLRRSGARTQTYYGIGYDSTLIRNRPEDGIIYVMGIDEYGPYFWIENTIGLGMDISISKNLFIRQKFGLGITLIYGKDKGNVIINQTGRTHIYGFLAYFGVGYKIKTKSP
ncbi:hypothetical protein GYB57_04180 [bacterium]|nr:hypothetical protein [bacterium]